MVASARIMWERHPDFRVAKLPDARWQVKVVTPRAMEWTNAQMRKGTIPNPVPCTIDGDLLLTPEQATVVADGVLDEGFELGDWS